MVDPCLAAGVGDMVKLRVVHSFERKGVSSTDGGGLR